MQKIDVNTKIRILNTCSFGIEAVLKRELAELGYDDLEVTNGSVEYDGYIRDIIINNLYLRTSDRVYVKLGEFKATTFDELYSGLSKIKFESWILYNTNFIINAKSVKSKLFSVRNVQSVSEKSIIDRLSKYYGIKKFEKSGAELSVEISILNDIATIKLDTSGTGLHKRGYRTQQGNAPIKETLAAAMVMLSFWKNNRTLYDLFCGSGTIAIEAAMIGKSIPAGIYRNFASERWGVIDVDMWEKFRKKARDEIKNEQTLSIIASDISGRMINIAKKNAKNIGLENDITFIKSDFRDMNITNNNDVIISNPPYAQRMGDREEVQKLYSDIGEKLNSLDRLSTYFITSDEKFEELYGKRASKKRKLYNGKIKVDYYQFFGKRKPRTK